MSDQNVRDLILGHLKNVGTATADDLSFGVATLLKKLNRSQEDFQTELDCMLSRNDVHLTIEQAISIENRTAPINLYALQEVLNTVEKPLVYPKFLHALRLLAESRHLLDQYIEPLANEICSEFSDAIKTPVQPVMAITNERYPNFGFTLFLKAFHFNVRAFVEEVLRILNQLAFVLRREGSENKSQPSTNFPKFYRQIKEGQLDYLDAVLLRYLKNGLKDIAFSRFVRNNFKMGAMPLYSREYKSGKASIRCEFPALKRDDEVIDDLITKGEMDGKDILFFYLPKSPRLYVRNLHNLLNVLSEVLMRNVSVRNK